MRVGRHARGQPLYALVLVLGLWVGERTVNWQAAAFTLRAPLREMSETGAATTAGAARLAAPVPLRPDAARQADVPRAANGATGLIFSPWPVWMAVMPGAAVDPRVLAASGPRLAQPEGAGPRQPIGQIPAAPSSRAGWYGFFLPAGANRDMETLVAPPTGDDRLPEGLAPAPSAHLATGVGGNVAPLGPLAPQPPRPARRWSGDSWLLMRAGGSISLANGPAPAAYGGNQAGAIVRYGFAPESELRPSAYARLASGLGEISQAEAALGLSGRPLSQLPVVVAGEVRFRRENGQTRVRPGALAVTQLPALDLPLRLHGEIYAQGGYVGGSGATPFVDGQVRVDRSLGTFGKSDVRIGAGAWGGAQQGASRLDVGPGATLGLGLGRSASARVAVDWRLRVAGNAEPDSGPAMTVSAGF